MTSTVATSALAVGTMSTRKTRTAPAKSTPSVQAPSTTAPAKATPSHVNYFKVSVEGSARPRTGFAFLTLETTPTRTLYWYTDRNGKTVSIDKKAAMAYWAAGYNKANAREVCPIENLPIRAATTPNADVPAFPPMDTPATV